MDIRKAWEKMPMDRQRDAAVRAAERSSGFLVEALDREKVLKSQLAREREVRKALADWIRRGQSAEDWACDWCARPDAEDALAASRKLDEAHDDA